MFKILLIWCSCAFFFARFLFLDFIMASRSRFICGGNYSFSLSKFFLLALISNFSFWTSTFTEPPKFDLLSPPPSFRPNVTVTINFLYTGNKNKIFNLHSSKVSQIDFIRKNSAYFGIILLLSGDLHPNPGPKNIKSPCGVCSKACTWKQKAVACDECQTWYHIKCMNMNSVIYNALNSISWYCCSCGLPNFSSGLFLNSSSSFDSLFNPFNSLSKPSESFYTPNPVSTT